MLKIETETTFWTTIWHVRDEQGVEIAAFNALGGYSKADAERMVNGALDEDRSSVPCSLCGKPTTWDATYNDLCYRCCTSE